jgi:hypothetical protein
LACLTIPRGWNQGAYRAYGRWLRLIRHSSKASLPSVNPNPSTMTVVSKNQSRMSSPPKTRPPDLGTSGQFAQTVSKRLIMPQHHPMFVMNFQHFQSVNPEFTNHFG